MDTFIEKIVAKKKDAKDYLITTGVILGAVVVTPFILSIQLIGSMGLLVVAAIIYGIFKVVTSRNIEFEYIVTNGDLDIDRIIAQRKRKRIFSANCKEFDIVARVKSEHYTPHIQQIKNSIKAVSSIDSENAFFITLHYSGEKTVVYFEPDERMLKNFRTFIPRKIHV
jgi:hypothetical protein